MYTLHRDKNLCKNTAESYLMIIQHAHITKICNNDEYESVNII